MKQISRLTWLGLILAMIVTVPAAADEYWVFNEGGIPISSDIWNWCAENAANPGTPCFFTPVSNCASPEGSNHLTAVSNAWVGFGVFLLDFTAVPPTNTVTEDLSSFANGEMRFWVKSSHDLNIEFQCQGSGKLVTLANTNWDGSATWQEITIPIADFFAPQAVDAGCLAQVNAPFLSTGANVPTNFQVDHVRWVTPNNFSGASSVQVNGRELIVNGEPFVVNGVAYSPISIGEDYHGSFRDRPDRYNIDFPLIAAAGANTIRVYNSFLTTGLLDAAWANGLFVIPTIGIDPIQFECAEGRQFLKDRVAETVTAHKDHPAILMWLMGNEVNIRPSTTSLCDATSGWFPILDELAEVAHLAEDPTYPAGSAYHPVTTATSEIADICMPACSDDTAMPNLDLWGTQIYRGCSAFTNAFSDYQAKADCSRPLLVTEFGADSWDSLSGPSGAENETMQSDCLQTMLQQADDNLAVRTPGAVSAGQVIFSWSDEWWKAQCDPGTAWDTHDTCSGWSQVGYPDPAINEEWWGLTSVDPNDPNARDLREAVGPVGDAWHPGSVCDVNVVSYDALSGSTTVSFNPAAGSTDHTLYYGPLSSVSSYGYSGSVTGLGADGDSSVTLSDPGSLFFVLVGRNNGAEGSYGVGTTERPASGGAAVPQDPNRTDICSAP